MSDGKIVTICDQSAQTMLTQTTANSGIYKLTFWPRKLFGAAAGQSVVSMTYFITDKTGATEVGYGNSSSPFTYKFKCT
jgi:hypothetical protein